MTAIKIVAETKHTVTVNRQDWVRLLAELEDAEDRLAVRSQRAREAAMGKAAIRQNSLSGEEARRLLEGESPARVWRQKRGLTQRALAKAAGVAASYLADIENGRKPGSADALSRIARALGVPMDDMMDEQQRRRDPGYGPVWLRLRSHPGIGPGAGGASPDEQRFISLREAMTFVRKEWQTLKDRSPQITDEQRLPIFNLEDLWREIEPELFGPDREPPMLHVRFGEPCEWNQDLSSYVLRATVDGEPIRCRIEFPDGDDDDMQVNPANFPPFFQRNRLTVERAFREAIRNGRFSGQGLDHETHEFRREVILNIRDFHILVGPGL
jgi:transcriptional regulator with XRE-family HTH domain